MRRSVAAAVSAMDDAIGLVTQSLKKAGMWKDTLLVFTSDNGGPVDGTDANMANNYPLRGCKGGYFEGGLRAVGLVHGYGIVSPGRLTNGLFHVTDWVPTLLAAVDGNQANSSSRFNSYADVPVGRKSNGDAGQWDTASCEPAWREGDGVNNFPMLRSPGEGSMRSEIIHVTQASGSNLNSQAIRVGDYKLVWNPASSDCSLTHPGWYRPPSLNSSTTFTVVCGPEPQVLDNCSSKSPCLFNIAADPYEHMNLAPSEPQIVAKLKARLQAYKLHTVQPMTVFRKLDPRADPSHFGGVWHPWLSVNEEAGYYPTNYSGPGYGAPPERPAHR